MAVCDLEFSFIVDRRPGWYLAMGKAETLNSAIGFQRLLKAIGDLHCQSVSSESEERYWIERVCQDMPSATDLQSLPTPKRLPVCRYLDLVFDQPHTANVQLVMTALQAVEPFLEWRQNENYLNRLDNDFLDRYAYSEWIGPGGFFSSNSLAAGVLLLGPETVYPDHNHPAIEFYHILSGAALWRKSGGNWESKSPGSRIFHQSWQPHAVKTRAEPLLALYFWTGEQGIQHAARLTGELGGLNGFNEESA